MTIPRISSLRHPRAPPGCFIFCFLFFLLVAYPPRSLYVVVRWHSRISVWTFWLPPWKKVLTKEERRKAPAKLNSFPCQTRRKFVSKRKATFFWRLEPFCNEESDIFIFNLFAFSLFHRDCHFFNEGIHHTSGPFWLYFLPNFFRQQAYTLDISNFINRYWSSVFAIRSQPPGK